MSDKVHPTIEGWKERQRVKFWWEMLPSVQRREEKQEANKQKTHDLKRKRNLNVYRSTIKTTQDIEAT